MFPAVRLALASAEKAIGADLAPARAVTSGFVGWKLLLGELAPSHFPKLPPMSSSAQSCFTPFFRHLVRSYAMRHVVVVRKFLPAVLFAPPRDVVFRTAKSIITTITSNQPHTIMILNWSFRELPRTFRTGPALHFLRHPIVEPRNSSCHI